MNDRDIIQWDKRLADQVARGWDNYKHLHIDLSQARIEQSFIIAGEYLYVEASSSADAIAKIKINRRSNENLDLLKDVKIETVFIEIFITNSALQDEWMDLVFGINFKYDNKRRGDELANILAQLEAINIDADNLALQLVQLQAINIDLDNMALILAELQTFYTSEAQPCILLTNVNPAVNTVAAANACSRVLIRAHTGNTGTIWIDFNNAAVVNACYELTAGDAISVPLSNTNLINGILTNGGDIATIVYEV